jgi:hypothetical protein
MLDSQSHLPDTNRLSVLAATVLLAYAVTPFITVPDRVFQFQLPGFLLSFTLNFATLTSILAAALAGFGADWLARGHPLFNHQSGDSRHWLLPALTAWVIGEPLNRLEIGLEWWAVFTLGGVMLAVVYVAEYITLDPADSRYVPAAVALTAVAFSLFLILAIALRAAGVRLYVILPASVIAVFMVVQRTLYLRLGGRWPWKWPVAISVITGQLVIGLHYWPVSPLQFGLILLGAAYALTSVAGGLEEGRSGRSLWVEPGVMLVVSLLMAALVRSG